MEKEQKIWNKKERVESQRKRPRSWYLNSFTSESVYLEKKIKRMLVRKMQDYIIEIKEKFIPSIIF